MECIVLAGGMGTRLRSVVQDLPKCMAPVAGRPFLFYLLRWLAGQGFEHIILALGYKHQAVETWLRSRPVPVKITCVVENQPLGTGGAVKYALSKTAEEDVFVLNGDSFFGVDCVDMLRVHRQQQAIATLALKRMENFDRYGVVELDASGYISRFMEKKFCAQGLINGGVYLIQNKALNDLPDSFSLEKDFFEQQLACRSLAGFVADGYFIDIGIPEDYRRAQTDFMDGKFCTL